MYSLCFKLGNIQSVKVDPFFGLFLWLIIWTLAPVWIPLHIILKLTGRQGFLWKGETVLAWEYWVIELSREGFSRQ